jgi:hypothetical protein
MIITKRVVENTEPWPSLLPTCQCYTHNKVRLIVHDGIVFCGTCGIAYSKAGCVGLVLISEIKT